MPYSYNKSHAAQEKRFRDKIAVDFIYNMLLLSHLHLKQEDGFCDKMSHLCTT